MVDSSAICSILGSTKHKMWMEGWPDCSSQIGLCLCGLHVCADRSPKCTDTSVSSQRRRWVAVSPPVAMMNEQLYSRVGCSICRRDIMDLIGKTGIPSSLPGIDFRSSSQHCDTLTAKSSGLRQTAVLYIFTDALQTRCTFCKYSWYTV